MLHLSKPRTVLIQVILCRVRCGWFRFPLVRSLDPLQVCVLLQRINDSNVALHMGCLGWARMRIVCCPFCPSRDLSLTSTKTFRLRPMQSRKLPCPRRGHSASAVRKNMHVFDVLGEFTDSVESEFISFNFSKF